MLKEFGGGGGFGEGVVEGPEGLGLVEGGIDGEATIVEGELGVVEIHGEDLVEEVEVGVEIRKLEKFFNHSDNFWAGMAFLENVNSFSNGEIGDVVDIIVTHE